MRRLMLIGFLAVMTLPAGAARRVTVAQLEQVLNGAIAAHKTDQEIARRIATLELSERLTAATLGRLDGRLAPGSQATLALALLADESAFLEAPAAESPNTAAPDDAEQSRMLNATRKYVAEALPSLPNFLATRTIKRYDDTPQAAEKGGWGVRLGLHLVATSNREISVRVERENQPPAQGSAVWQEQIGLISGGEFGTTLGMILADMSQGSVRWSSWEATASGLDAVFQYSVPRSASHFEVIGSRERTNLVGLGTVARGSSPSSLGVQPGDPSNTTIVRTRPSYHGSIWLDPATGSVLRITMEADAKDGAPFERAGILVQYGQVQIGDSKFICPIRSLALSKAVPDPRALYSDAPTEWLNETIFSEYHRFASTTRILNDSPAPPPEKPNGGTSTPH